MGILRWDLKRLLSSFLFQVHDTIDTVRKTFLHVLSVFLIWFTIVFAIGIAILMTIKMIFILFPEI